MSEFVGTFFLVLTVGLNVLQNAALAPVAIGSILMVMIFATGSVSGGHFNPAVTLGVVLCGPKANLNHAVAGVYVIVQIFAGFIASMVYYGILGATFTLAPGPGYSAIDAAVAETLFTAALVFVVLNVAVSTQSEGNHYYGLAIGFTVMSAAFAIGGISGCSLNPAVTFGVMLSHAVHAGGSGLGYFPLYFLAPLLGSVIGAGLFRVVRGAEFRKRALP